MELVPLALRAIVLMEILRIIFREFLWCWQCCKAKTSHRDSTSVDWGDPEKALIRKGKIERDIEVERALYYYTANNWMRFVTPH